MGCYFRNWYLNNRESKNETSKKWVKAHYIPKPKKPSKWTPEYTREYYKKQYQENKEYYREYNRQYHEKHKNDEVYLERKRRNTREYYKRLKEKERLLDEMLEGGKYEK